MSEENITPEKEVSGTSTNSAPSVQSIRNFLSGDGTKPPLRAMVPVGQIPLHKPDHACKLIGVTNIHHRDRNGKVSTTTSRFVRELSSKDEQYKRTITVGETWEELDTAWVKPDAIGYLMIRNDGGRPFQVIPTKEQLEEARARVIEIGYMLMDYSLPSINNLKEEPTKKRTRTMWDAPQDDTPILSAPIIPLWLVIPGEDHRGLPCKEHPIYIRCQRGETSVTVLAIPK